MNIEKLLQSGQTKIPNLNRDFGNNVMKEIASRQVSIAPVSKWHLKNILNFSLSGVSIFLIVLLINAFIYEVKMNGSLEMLNFGKDFIADFAIRLPLDLIFSSVVFMGISVFFLHQTKQMHKIAITYLSLFIFVFTGISGTVLAYSGVNEELQEVVLENESNIPFMQHFYVNRAMYNLEHDNFTIGIVKSLAENTVTIDTPFGTEEKISLPEGVQVKIGDHIRIKGIKTETDSFEAEIMQHCNPSKTQRYYRHCGETGGCRNSNMMKRPSKSEK